MYYRGAKAAIVVYDITCITSFEKAKSWVEELQLSSTQDIVIVLAGNKLDLEKNRKIETSEAEEYSNENNLIFIETTAKEPNQINELFQKIGQQVPKTSNIETSQESNIYNYDDSHLIKSRKKCC